MFNIRTTTPFPCAHAWMHEKTRNLSARFFERVAPITGFCAVGDLLSFNYIVFHLPHRCVSRGRMVCLGEYADCLLFVVQPKEVHTPTTSAIRTEPFDRPHILAFLSSGFYAVKDSENTGEVVFPFTHLGCLKDRLNLTSRNDTYTDPAELSRIMDWASPHLQATNLDQLKDGIKNGRCAYIPFPTEEFPNFNLYKEETL